MHKSFRVRRGWQVKLRFFVVVALFSCFRGPNIKCTAFKVIMLELKSLGNMAAQYCPILIGNTVLIGLSYDRVFFLI